MRWVCVPINDPRIFTVKPWMGSRIPIRFFQLPGLILLLQLYSLDTPLGCPLSSCLAGAMHRRWLLRANRSPKGLKPTTPRRFSTVAHSSISSDDDEFLLYAARRKTITFLGFPAWLSEGTSKAAGCISPNPILQGPWNRTQADE